MKSNPELHLAEFQRWLPRELVYSRRKAPYESKTERAARRPDDPTSMFVFLGQEWTDHQLMRRGGNHHASDHRKTAQLQAAKFAAGLVDKAAIVTWRQAGSHPDMSSMRMAARNTVRAFAAERPWERSPYGPDHIAAILEQPFVQTPFASGILEIMDGLVAVKRDPLSSEAVNTRNTAFSMAGLAVNCYTQYASEHLTPEQVHLAPSRMVTQS